MPNIKLMETALPIAPLKIAALDSCKELGQRVDQYIVRFRQDTLRESLDSPLFSGWIPIWWNPNARALAPGKPRA